MGCAVLNAIIAIVVLFLYKDLNPYEPFNTENHITTVGALLIKIDAVILLYVKVTVKPYIARGRDICIYFAWPPDRTVLAPIVVVSSSSGALALAGSKSPTRASRLSPCCFAQWLRPDPPVDLCIRCRCSSFFCSSFAL